MAGTEPPILIEVYAGDTAEGSAREFAKDAVDMADEGYTASSQTWLGSTLLVAYQAAKVEGPQARVTLVRMPLGEWVVAGFMFAIGTSLFGLLLGLVVAVVLVLVAE